MTRARTPRVCFFNRSYHPDVSATGQLLTELAEDLARYHGHDVWVVTGPPLTTAASAPAGGWWPFGREHNNGVHILRARGTRFSPRRFPGRLANYLSYFASACVAAWWVPRPDVVVALTDPPIIGLSALMTARRARAGFVYVCQDVFPEVAVVLADFESDTVNRLLDRINRFLLRRADRVVAVGETMAERLVTAKGADPDTLSVIHNWADCAAIVPGPKRNRFATAHGLVERFVVMHSGNIGLSQGLETLLDAAERLRACPDLVVVLIGDGTTRETLQARARARGLANVRFLPYQPKETLAESFATADVFVISLKAGLAGAIVPSKLYGILAAGRPYVAAVEQASEVAQITAKFGCGLCADPGDADDLARKVSMLYHDRALAERLGTSARHAALQFDRTAQVAAYAALFEEVHAERARAVDRPPILKRPFDVALSSLGLLGSAPLWAVIALAIKLEDGGPVFYGHERVGKGGRRFLSWKFRSMVTDSDARYGPLQARDRDPRVTRVGRVLRATAMDELPQLWNILTGDMSFVGPRPLLPEEIEVSGERRSLDAIPGYQARQRVTPGLTGIAQVFADRDIPRRQKFRLDQLYARRQSFWLDVKLIALSFWITFRGRWERRGRKL